MARPGRMQIPLSVRGFDNRMCQNAFYGAGVYFACAACKSHQYTCNQHKKCCSCKCQRTVIIARVALGDSYVATETRKKERRPPVRSGSSGTYDSIVVKPGLIKGHHKPNQVHQEYVIFDREAGLSCFCCGIHIVRIPWMYLTLEEG